MADKMSRGVVRIDDIDHWRGFISQIEWPFARPAAPRARAKKVRSHHDILLAEGFGEPLPLSSGTSRAMQRDDQSFRLPRLRAVEIGVGRNRCTVREVMAASTRMDIGPARSRSLECEAHDLLLRGCVSARHSGLN